MGKTFAKVKLCQTNDFPPPQNEGIKRWVENNGGTFQQQISSDTTHLVCSKTAWKRNSHPLLVAARRHNKELSRNKVPHSKRIQIVKYDWLEDSLSSKSRKPKDTRGYDWEERKTGRLPALIVSKPSLTRAEEGETKVEKVDRKMIEFSNEVEEFEIIMHTKGYHPYADNTGFLYLIVLVRRDIEKNLTERHRIKVRYSPHSLHLSVGTRGHSTCPIRYLRFSAPYPFAAYPVVEANRLKNFRFKPRKPDRHLRVPIPDPWAHCLQLFESDTTPRKYACYLSYTAGRPGVKRETQVLAPAHSDWEFAWGMFTKIFKLKTGVDWDARPGLNGAADGNCLQMDSGTTGFSKKYFEYMPPKAGSPQGLPYSNGSIDAPSLESHSSGDGKAVEGVSLNVEVVRGVGDRERRPSVTLVIPSSATAAVDNVAASAMTPKGGW